MDKDFNKLMKSMFGDDLNDTELRMLELMPKAREYCNVSDDDYKFLLDMLVSILKAKPELQAFMPEIAGLVNYSYVTGIEHQKKQQIMQAFLNAEEK